MTNIEKLMQAITDEGVCAMVTDPVNRRYFTGFKSSEGVVLCFSDKAYFLVDFRYYEKAAEVVKGMEVILMTDKDAQVMDILLKHSAECLLIEADTMTVSGLQAVSETLGDVVYIDSSSELSDIISELRLIKESSDVEKIIAAQRIAEQGFEYVLEN
ncbi:MAG: aminopeptidase P family N-terminal domain-containing protein, partial [Oscillospiraceae bacterium]|nr:aminopeptidase P family N-terminal domain-containing protein [Oscillospiraceae bacterium]